eukprot:1140923-Pelagomonas_calceolata.AAC.2
MCALRASRRLEKCLSFRAGESGLLEVLAWERAASSKASQVVSWKGLPSSEVRLSVAMQDWPLRMAAAIAASSALTIV